MRLKQLPVAIVVCVLGMLPCALAQSPATQPTTRPADEFAAGSSVRSWFKQLADPDPKIRDKARTDLMGIRAGDLPKLRQLVIENQPISPAQSSALHDIVVQAFLTAEKYNSADGETDVFGSTGPFFLGITWTDEVGEDESERLGALVGERLPGFPGYRFLREGDMILGVYVNPNRPLQESPNIETHTRQALIGAISGTPDAPRSVQQVVLEVLRDGESIKIPIAMAARPIFPDQELSGAIKEFNRLRTNRAEAYWQANFAPLLEPKNVASNLDEGP